MMTIAKRYRTIPETIDLFRRYQFEYEKRAARADDPTERAIAAAKADCYGIAELENLLLHLCIKHKPIKENRRRSE